jgi:hypothetical protein
MVPIIWAMWCRMNCRAYRSCHSCCACKLCFVCSVVRPLPFHRLLLSTVVIFGRAFRRSSLSFSVGVSPNFSSALSDRNKPTPAYAMIPTPMTTRVLGVIPLYHLRLCQTSSIEDHGIHVLPYGHVGGVLDQPCLVKVSKSWGRMTKHKRAKADSSPHFTRTGTPL